MDWIAWAKRLTIMIAALSCAGIYAQPQKQAVAKAPLFQIEVIVFENIEIIDSAIHAHALMVPKSKLAVGAIELAPVDEMLGEGGQLAPTTLPSFQLFSSKSWRLSPEEKALAHQDNYHVLAHLAWQQPISRQKSTVHITGGEPFAKSGVPLDLGYTNLLSTLPRDVFWKIDGTISLHQSHFFELDTHLQLFAGHPALVAEHAKNSRSEMPSQAPLVYLMNQHRRLKADQLNYIDHPKFGLLIKIEPVVKLAKTLGD